MQNYSYISIIALFFYCFISVVSNTTCFFVSKSFKNLDFKGNLQ